MLTEENMSNAAKYYSGNMPYSLAAVQARETEKNIRAGKNLIKAIVVALAIIGIVSTTSGCVNDGDVLVKVECSLFPAGQQPPSCN